MNEEQLKTRSLQHLRQLGSRPAVPFQEAAVSDYIASQLPTLGVVAKRNGYGNLIAHRPGIPNDREDRPPIALVAHMDHPGFEVVEVHGTSLIARALGGVPQSCFSENVPVQAVMPDGVRLKGQTWGAHGEPGQRLVGIQLAESFSTVSVSAPVVFDLPDFEVEGDLIRMRALDDLAGCAAILVALETLSSDQDVGDVYGVFTRAEEVGLIGAGLLAESDTLPDDTLVVSLEASRALPGAEIGGGPVIRVGDASFTFDADAESALLKAREELVEMSPDFKAQRQLMSGGTCEASAFRFRGYRATGIAFPLGNYHNAGPDGKVAAEHLRLDDFVGGVRLLLQSLKCVGRRQSARPWQRMEDVPEDYRRRLYETA